MAAETGEVVLSIRNAVRRYPPFVALADVSMVVRAGEVYALLGRNGAGKSTLVKAAVGAIALSAGSVRVLGVDPARSRAARRAIGVAPQETALWGHLTVEENLLVFAAMAGVARSARAEAVRQAAAAAGCEQPLRRRIDTLSGGWRRRANLAAALVHRPRLLILDEPTEGLDAEMKLALRSLVGRLRAGRTAVLLISHDMDDVAGLADRLGVLEAGRLVAEGATGPLLDRAFAGRQALCVRLPAPCPAAARALADLGFVGDGLDLNWEALVEDAWSEAARVDGALKTAQASGCELTVRRPGLEAFIAWAGQGLAA